MKSDKFDYEGRTATWRYDDPVWKLDPLEWVKAATGTYYWLQEVPGLPRRQEPQGMLTQRWVVALQFLGQNETFLHRVYRGLVTDKDQVEALATAISARMWSLVDESLMDAHKYNWARTNRVVYCPKCRQQVNQMLYIAHVETCSKALDTR